jgi:hypothetical protein
MKLTERSRKIFVEALTNPPKPNDAAIAAAKRFKLEAEAQPSSGPPPSRLPIRLQPRRACPERSRRGPQIIAPSPP